MPIQAPKGTRDILPNVTHRWHYLESIIREVCRIFGYQEIRVPLFEHTELFSRGVGETTDIVQKEMYTFTDKAGRSLTLRPEGTAGVARAFIEHGMSAQPMPHKMYYYGPMYRYENVQHGRYREFWQFGCEVIGSAGPEADVEVIAILKTLFEKAGLKETDLRINSIGCAVCRPQYHKLLRDYFEPKIEHMCADCRRRFERNPLRIIDCKQEQCKKEIADAPLTLDHICNECQEHFEGLKSGLSNIGIKYSIDKKIVRGLDYYTRTVFEYISNSDSIKTLGSSICGGGRYDGLVSVCGGPQTPGVGFSVGIERLFIELDSNSIVLPDPNGTDIFIVAAGIPAKMYAARMVSRLREAGICAEMDLNDRSVKAQMKYANKRNAVYTVVIGDNEIDAGKAVLRKMADGEVKEVSLDNFCDELININASDCT